MMINIGMNPGGGGEGPPAKKKKKVFLEFFRVRSLFSKTFAPPPPSPNRLDILASPTQTHNYNLT